MTDAIRSKLNAKISARILAYMVNGGMTLQQAFDKVLGQSQYECMAHELHDAFNAEA
jgi:type II secretory pathway component PulF